MTDPVVTAAKADVATARTGVRAWIADHPFTWTAIAAGVGFAAAVAVYLVHWL
ncbi:MAG TPA: hypothetical protein VMV19_17790 [Xanthobacteraceae bacterium]|nr:hypothetical protein [Xanthobacteraceae bacterium]